MKPPSTSYIVRDSYEREPQLILAFDNLYSFVKLWGVSVKQLGFCHVFDWLAGLSDDVTGVYSKTWLHASLSVRPESRAVGSWISGWHV